MTATSGPAFVQQMLQLSPITPCHPDYEPLGIQLPHKFGATIKYRFFPGTNDHGPKPSLVIFLNGLLTSMDTWLPIISGLRDSVLTKTPAILCYDRFGQGFTEDRDPLDRGREPGHGHDCNDAAQDLNELLEKTCLQYFDRPLDESFDIVLVGNSIGCAIARLLVPLCTIPIKGFLFLDSIMANSDFDLWPDPDSPDFDPVGLPPELANGGLKEQRKAFLARFGPNVVNKEGLNRRNLLNLLPNSTGPPLIKGPVHPWLTVAGHDPVVFANNSFEQMGTSTYLSSQYTNPAWHRYNQDLTRLTCLMRNRDRSEPVIVNSAGHFVQQDRPDFVLLELMHILKSIEAETSPCQHAASVPLPED